MEIRELDESWKGKNFVLRYTSWHNYRVNIVKNPGEITFQLKREALSEPMVKSFDDSLYGDWLNKPKVFGLFDTEKLLGFIELSLEDWNNRLRIANIWVDEGYRYQGIGKSLITKAVETAKNGGQRAIILETQRCNYPAVRF